VLGDGDDVASGDLGNGDTAVGLVGSVEVNMVGSDAGGDSELQVLGLGQSFGGKVAGVEGSGDDDFGVDKLLVELGVFALLVRGSDEGVTLVFKPLADAELVLGCAEHVRDVQGMLPTVVKDEKNLDHFERVEACLSLVAERKSRAEGGLAGYKGLSRSSSKVVRATDKIYDASTVQVTTGRQVRYQQVNIKRINNR
jgi:hypothetical protein